MGDGGGGGLLGGGGDISAGAGASSSTPPASRPPIVTNVRIVRVVPASPAGINPVTVFVTVVPNEVPAPSAPVGAALWLPGTRRTASCERLPLPASLSSAARIVVGSRLRKLTCGDDDIE